MTIVLLWWAVSYYHFMNHKCLWINMGVCKKRANHVTNINFTIIRNEIRLYKWNSTFYNRFSALSNLSLLPCRCLLSSNPRPSHATFGNLEFAILFFWRYISSSSSIGHFNRSNGLENFNQSLRFFNLFKTGQLLQPISTRAWARQP